MVGVRVLLRTVGRLIILASIAIGATGLLLLGLLPFFDYLFTAIGLLALALLVFLVGQISRLMGGDGWDEFEWLEDWFARIVNGIKP